MGFDFWLICTHVVSTSSRVQQNCKPLHFNWCLKYGQSKHCFHLNRYRFHNYRDFSATCVYVVSTSCSSVQRAPLVLHHLVVNMSWCRCATIGCYLFIKSFHRITFDAPATGRIAAANDWRQNLIEDEPLILVGTGSPPDHRKNTLPKVSA